MLVCFAGTACGALLRAYGCPFELTIIPLFALLLSFRSGVPGSRLALLTVIVSFAWTGLFLNPPWQRYLSQLPREHCSLTARLRLKQAAVPPPPGHVPPGRPRLIAEIVAIRTIGDSDFRPSTGLVLLQADKILFPQLAELSAGTEFTADGTISPPPARDDLYGFYGDYLKSLGVHRIFRLDEFTVTGCSDSLPYRGRRLLNRMRGKLAAALADGFPDSPLTGIYLVLGTGLNEYLSPALRQSFIRSGTVHIFAISGLHVGMVMQFCLLLLKTLGLRLRPRWLACALLTIVYAAITGMSPSSIRALVMVLLALYANLRFRPVSALHTVSLTGTAALLANPLLVLHSGFLFSYTAVLVLVGTWPLVSFVHHIITERQFWIPARYRNQSLTGRLLAFFRIDQILFALPSTLSSSCLAWLASAGLAARSSSHLCLLSPLVNLPVGVLLLVILLSFPLKILAAFLPESLNILLIKTMQFFLNLLQLASDTAAYSHWSLPVRTLPWWLLLAYYIGFLCFLIPVLKMSVQSCSFSDAKEIE